MQETEEHLDPNAEITLDTVKSRAVKGVVVLTGRTFILSALSLVATGLLTVFLSDGEAKNPKNDPTTKQNREIK